MPWCDACAYAVKTMPTSVEVVYVKQGEEPKAIGMDVLVVPEELKQKPDEIRSLVERRLAVIRRTYERLSNLYDDVLWCTKLRTFVVRKRGQRTAEADATACPFFKPKS